MFWMAETFALGAGSCSCSGGPAAAVGPHEPPGTRSTGTPSWDATEISSFGASAKLLPTEGAEATPSLR